MSDPTVILGLDIGDRHIGVAIGNTITHTATPLPDLPNSDSLTKKLLALHEEYSFSKIIVGLPVTTTGQHGSQAQKVESLVEEMRACLPIEIILEDERFTTQSASKFLANNPTVKATIDGISAKFILEEWLNRIA